MHLQDNEESIEVKESIFKTILKIENQMEKNKNQQLIDEYETEIV